MSVDPFHTGRADIKKKLLWISPVIKLWKTCWPQHNLPWEVQTLVKFRHTWNLPVQTGDAFPQSFQVIRSLLSVYTAQKNVQILKSSYASILHKNKQERKKKTKKFRATFLKFLCRVLENICYYFYFNFHDNFPSFLFYFQDSIRLLYFTWIKILNVS